MNRRQMISMLVGTSASCHAIARGQDAADGAPRWKFLGDDDALRKTISEAGQIVLVCVFGTSLDHIKPPFAEVALRSTVVQVVKGTHSIGDKIVIRFPTDSLPAEDAARKKFIEDADARNLGSLKLAFLQGNQSGDYPCEWLDVAAFDPDMLAFVMKNNR